MKYFGLRSALVDYLVTEGMIQQEIIKKAFLKVPRHIFVEAQPEDVYSDQALVLKREGNQVISTISQPSIVAYMLEQLGVNPGDNILEIGTGLGYNAALLACLTEKEGTVTTVEYAADLSERAARNLDLFSNVTCIHGDGRLGYRQNAPYNKIIVTVTATDIYSQWQGQLSDSGGTILLPLRIAPSLTRLLRLVKNRGELEGGFSWAVNFVNMSGEEEDTTSIDNLLSFVRGQNLSAGAKDSLLFYCLAFTGEAEEAREQWFKDGCPKPADFVVRTGSGKLTLEYPSVRLKLCLS